MKKAIATVVCVMFLTVLFAQEKPQGTSKVEVKPPDIPKCITEWITKNLPGYTVASSYKLETKKGGEVVWMYYVQTKKEKTVQWVSGDAKCNEVKKINPKEAETTPKTKPPTGKN
jgi:hypothetical protein